LPSFIAKGNFKVCPLELRSETLHLLGDQRVNMQHRLLILTEKNLSARWKSDPCTKL